MSAQVIIKERVSIYPNSTPPITLDGVISGDPHNPVYLRYGGNVIMEFVFPSYQYNTQLWEQTLGEVARNKSQGDTVMLGSFPQWTKFQFWVINEENPEVKWYLSVLSASIVDPDLVNPLYFYFKNFLPGDTIPYYPDRAWDINLTRNDNLVAMPPPEILDFFGNPFVPSEEIIIPADGTVYMTVEDVNSNVLIDLYQDMPENQLLLSDLGSNEGETINFGRKSAGDRLRFYIQSGHTLVSGMNLYPKTYDDEFYSYFDGSILFKDLWFEDWTDLLFENLNCSVYLIPDHYADFPWSLDVELSPSVISPGDTAQVILKWRNPDGSLENFPDSLLFDVEIMSGYEYGNLFSPDIPFNFDWYYGLTQGFSFVAVDTIDVDSVWVSIWVGKSGGIISGVSQGKPTAMVAQRSDQVRIKNFKDRKKPTVNGQPILKLGNTDNTGGMGYTIEDVEYPPFFMGFGEVLITEEKPLEIMLGETKYFQARVEPSDTSRLLIEERESPTLTSDGINEDVWGNEPLEIITGDTTYGKRLGVYWEKEKPIINSANLPKGLIRLVGRYWHEDSIYQVKLTANYHGKTASIKIKVIKPTKLGSSYGNSVDVFNMDFNLDSTCVVWGGLFGIPPHFLKGHIHHEANLHNGKFKPTYVYEPYTTQFSDSVIAKTQNPFFVDSMGMGTGACVPNSNGCITHQNVRRYSYPTEPQTVWDMVHRYSQLDSSRSPGGYSLYGTRVGGPDGPMWFYGVYDVPQLEYNKYLVHFNRKLEVKQYPERQTQANNRARDSLIVFLRDEWNGGVAGGIKGLANIYAQTRIAASYGLFQVLYINAIELTKQPYPENANNRPEDLNITDSTFAIALRMQKNYLINKLGLNVYTNGNWAKGLERTVMDAVWRRWNPGKKGYAGEVLQFTLQYLPSR